MVSIISTPQDPYKGFWFSSEENIFMDQTKPERPSPRYTYSAPLTDPTSLQSLLPVSFPLPTQQPLDLKLPETKLPRKRKASDVEDLAMPQQYRRPRQERPENATIDPQNLTTPFTSAQVQYVDGQYVNGQYVGQMPVTTSPYPTWQPAPLARNPPVMEQYYPSPYEGETPSDYSHRTSITSTGSQPIASHYAPSFPSSYHGLQYQPHPQPYHPSGSYPSYVMSQPTVQTPTPTLGSTPRSRGPSQPQGLSGLPSHVSPALTFSTPPPQHQQPPQQQQPTEAQRPKPQCWEHGCNGREFSTFSNLLRHQRERRGTAPRSICPRCGAEFTRSTARTNHLLNSKCKPRRSSS